MPEQLRKIVRGKADTPLRQVEAELMAHWPAQPGIDARRGRPDRFDQAAEDHAVGFCEPRLELAEDVELRAALFGTPHHAVGESGLEYFGIVTCLDHQTDFLLAAEQIVEGGGEHHSVPTFECGGDAMLVRRQIHQHLAMALRQLGKVMRLGRREGFQRHQRLAER